MRRPEKPGVGLVRVTGRCKGTWDSGEIEEEFCSLSENVCVFL